MKLLRVIQQRLLPEGGHPPVGERLARFGLQRCRQCGRLRPDELQRCAHCLPTQLQLRCF